MNINSNRTFFCDSLNVTALACVASKIESACLSSRDRTVKISEDFFKSPIQTTLKKIAQCLSVPIVVCGALKLVCFIVKACWNRCFPPVPPVNYRKREKTQVFDLQEKDLLNFIPCVIIHKEVVVKHILPYLNLDNLGKCRSVCKVWNDFASTPILWQSAIYFEIAFSSKNWGQKDPDLVKDVDINQEIGSLPENIAEELRCSAFAGHIRETHVLVRRTKKLTLNKLGELKGYRDIWPPIIDELKDKPAEESWLLMTKDVLQGSRNKSYIEQQNIVANLAATTEITYQVPTTLEAATCILAEFFRSEDKNRLFNDSPWTYTRCEEKVQEFQVIVGGFDLNGFNVTRDYSYKHDDLGVAVLRKF